MKRKDFLRNCSMGAAVLYLPSSVSAQTDRPPQLDKQLVQDFVGAGHNNLEKVKQLYAEHPTLIYATHDLGGGDFETALEGAGHVGNKEIANFLIEKGARTNMFVLTMLGKTAIVKPYLEAFPSYVFARGPHGLTLLHHAQRGGEDAKELLEYLKSKGLKETKTRL
ncbi:hypothetical protein [Sediminibacterium goheungense]|nr:hypothetical protein [Sediminibacterium goheungense]